MKYGILTWYIGYNIGAVLQAKALQYKACNLIDDKDSCVTIHYQTQMQNKGYEFCRQLWHTRARNFRTFLENIYMFPIYRKRKKLIDEFIDRYICESESYDETNIIKANDVFDAFIFGSDQIWNPKWIDSVYLADFACDNKKIISYAASLGVPYIPQNMRKIFENNLKRFQYISLREESSVNEISNLTGRNDVTCVCDPTLLLTKEEWIEAIDIDLRKENNFSPYVLCYFWGGG